MERHGEPLVQQYRCHDRTERVGGYGPWFQSATGGQLRLELPWPRQAARRRDWQSLAAAPIAWTGLGAYRRYRSYPQRGETGSPRALPKGYFSGSPARGTRAQSDKPNRPRHRPASSPNLGRYVCTATLGRGTAHRLAGDGAGRPGAWRPLDDRNRDRGWPMALIHHERDPPIARRPCYGESLRGEVCGMARLGGAAWNAPISSRCAADRLAAFCPGRRC